MPVPTSQLSIEPLEHSAGFGCIIKGVDLNDLTDDEFKQIEYALYKYKLCVIKDQPDLKPTKQYEFNRRFDPAASGMHGHGSAKEVMSRQFKGKRNITAGLPSVPECPMVRVVGKGTWAPGHYGTEETLELTGASHAKFHQTPLTEEELAAGDTRFQRWHIDAQFWKDNHTARVTTLWAHTLPKGPDLNVRWDDGSGQTMRVAPGRTAFIDGVQMYDALSDADKQWVQHSKVEYAPYPYEWIIDCKSMSNGFALESEDRETPIADLPEHEEGDAQTLPLIWANPVTGEKALQFHAIIARRLHIKESADGPVRIVDDVRQVRKILYDLQRPFLKEENIIVSPQEEGDLALWYNRGLRHCPIEYPISYGPRMCHQCHLQGSDPVDQPSAIAGQPNGLVAA